MEGGMQFPPYLYELFKRVKSIVVPEFLLYDFFFHVKSCPISGSVADPALTGTRATTLFSNIVPTFCRLGILSIQKLLYFSLSNFRFGCRPSPYRQLEKNLCILVPWIVSKKQSPKKAQKDFTKVKIVEFLIARFLFRGPKSIKNRLVFGKRSYNNKIKD